MKSKILIAVFAVAVAASFAFIGINKSESKKIAEVKPVKQNLSGFTLEDNQF